MEENVKTESIRYDGIGAPSPGNCAGRPTVNNGGVRCSVGVDILTSCQHSTGPRRLYSFYSLLVNPLALRASLGEQANLGKSDFHGRLLVQLSSIPGSWSGVLTWTYVRLKSNALWRSILWNLYFFMKQIPALNWLWLVYDANRYMILSSSCTPICVFYLSVAQIKKQFTWLWWVVTPHVRQRSKYGCEDEGQWSWWLLWLWSWCSKWPRSWDVGWILIATLQIYLSPHIRLHQENNPGFLAFLPLTEDPLILGPCVKQIRRESPGERENILHVQISPICHMVPMEISVTLFS